MKIRDKFRKGAMESIVEFKLEFLSDGYLIEDSLSIKIYELELKENESYFLLASDLNSELQYFLCSSIEEATELTLYAFGDFTSIYEDGCGVHISIDNEDFISDLMKLHDFISEFIDCDILLNIEDDYPYYTKDELYEKFCENIEEDETHNAALSSVDYMIETREVTILDSDLPF